MFNKNSKILVAGGTGMVGSAIIRALKKRGFTNITATFFHHKPATQYPDVKYYKIDLTNQLQTAQFLALEMGLERFISGTLRLRSAQTHLIAFKGLCSMQMSIFKADEHI